MQFTSRTEANNFYATVLAKAEHGGAEEVDAVMRELCLNDLWFLMTAVMGRSDMNNRPEINPEWLFARVQEINNDPDGYLDLWAREHYKSTVITFGKTIQDILKDPEVTVGIFSVQRELAQDFLKQIKQEFERNTRLKELFPDILYEQPEKESPCWGIDKGIRVKRKANSREETVEAWGLINGMPTGKHFKLLIYDDVVTEKSVTNHDQLTKAYDQMRLSFSLGSHGGRRRMIGTRYHFNDAWGSVLKAGTAKERIHPATVDGKPTSDPVFLRQDIIAEKRRDQGPYIFACHGAGTLVTMADWSQKKIEDVVVGDIVVGWAHIDGSKATLTPTQVIAINSRIAPAIESKLEDGGKLIHTPNHKWWTGRAPRADRKSYSPLGFGFGQQKGVCKAIDLSFTGERLNSEQLQAAGYLAGMIDGEGGVNHRTIQITQDCVLHPHVCEKIEWSLEILGFDYSIFDRKRDNRKGVQRIYTLKGGRQARVRMLNLFGNLIAKREKIESQCYGSRNFGKQSRVKLTSQKDIGETIVFNIQTETGNYIANGYTSKNCQMLQNPKADEVQGFKKEWLRYYETEPELYRLNVYILVDPASEKKKNSDFTVFWVLGLGADRNYYILDLVRDRMNLKERTDMLFELHNEYQPEDVGYEKFGMQADVEHIESEMDRRRYRFNITTLTDNTPKHDRIKRLIPKFEQGRFWFPRTIYRKNYEGKREELISLFIESEYEGFPVILHDDMLDDLANILHPKFFPIFPKATRRNRKMSWEDKLQRKLAMQGGGVAGAGVSHMAS